MKAVIIGRGVCTLGGRKYDHDGNVVSETQAKFEFDEEGSSIAVAEYDTETEQICDAYIYAVSDPAGYLAAVQDRLNTGNPGNIPDFREIFRSAYGQGDVDFFCDHCKSPSCSNCIVNDWREEFIDAF